MYKTELDAIEAAKSETSARDLAGALGGSANTSFETYRENFAGVNRTEADGELLSDICDELFDIAQQMRAISDEIDIDINEQNLNIVEQNLALYEREFRAIAEAQKT